MNKPSSDCYKKVKTPLYIFLDIDGVLNTNSHLALQQRKTDTCSVRNWCPMACSNIVRLCKQYNASIIVSSSWRDQYELEELREIFNDNGILASYVIDTTPSGVEQQDGYYCRGLEIQQWLDNNASRDASYLIIDDISNMLPSHEEYLVHVNPEDGFANAEAVAKAAQILRNGKD